MLAADTLVALENKIIGKPADLNQAAQILQRLSGRTHEVCSTVFICHFAAGRTATFYEFSRVRFRRLIIATIEHYLAEVDPLDKAGAYAAQGCGAAIIVKIDGSYTNVVGLPMEKTVTALAQFGIRPKVHDGWPSRSSTKKRGSEERRAFRDLRLFHLSPASSRLRRTSGPIVLK